MNSEMDHPKSHNTSHEYDENPHRHDQNVGIEIGHKEEHHGEKKSMLKKVKAKAKKIKDSIKEHVGQGHDHDEDEDEDEDDDQDDEMVMDPEAHAAHTAGAQHVMPGQEGAARRHTHTREPQFGERTAGEGTRTKPSAYHTFDPTTATHTPGQEETNMGWSTDSGGSKEYDEQPYAPKNTPVGTLSGGGHSTGDLDMGKKGPPAKLGTVAGGPIGVEEDPQAPEDVGEDHHPVNYQVRVIDPTGTGYDPKTGQSFMPGLHRSEVDEKTERERIMHSPKSKFQGEFQTFDPSTTGYVPGQEETLGQTRTDTGRPHRPEELSNASKHTPIAAHPGYDSTAAQSFMPEQHRSKVGERTEREGALHSPKSKLLDDFQTFDPSTTSHLPGQEETLGWSRTDTGRLNGSEKPSNASKYSPIAVHSGHDSSDAHMPQSFMPGQHISKLGERTAVEVKLDDPEDKVQGDRLTSVRTTTSYVPGQEETLDWLSHDTGRLNGSEELSHASKNTPVVAHSDDPTAAQSFMPGIQRSKFDEDTALEGMIDTPGNNLQGDCLTAHKVDKAVQAKDVVATKLGYGGNQEGHPHEKTAPMYGNVGTVGLKMQDSGTENEVHSSSTTEMDKGVSMKDYLAEKLKPGEEDKALSKVITEALPLHKRKEDVSKVGEEGKGDKVTIKGRVTESEEVARQFGRSEETNYDNAGAGTASPGKGVLDRLKDAASFWFQKGTEIPSQDDIVEGNEGSPVISSMESEQKKEEKRVGGSGLQQ